MLPKGTPIITTPAREVRNVEEKARARQALREYIIKERSNPFRQAANIGGGFIEDTAFIRYESINTFSSECTFCKPTLRTTRSFLGLIIAPILLIGGVSEYYRRTFEAKVRRGEVSYADRYNKFV